MKYLYLIRHAKSSWSDPGLADHDRPLNKRGKSDIPVMGKRFVSYSPHPEMIISSSAKRARKTARGIGKELGFDKDDIILFEALYTFSSERLITVIRTVHQSINVLAVVGHNYGLTDCAESLSGNELGNIPTCGVTLIEFPINDWKHISSGSGRLLRFDYPKLHS